LGNRGGRKVVNFYNSSGELANLVKFLEEVQKKINYLNLNCKVDGKAIKITLKTKKHLFNYRLENLVLVDYFGKKKS